MKKIFYLLVFAASLSGCSADEGSYQGVLIVNEERFILEGHDQENDYTINKQIGTVANTVKPEVIPTGHLSSNHLKKGTELFSSKESHSIILVKQNNGLAVFKKESPD